MRAIADKADIYEALYARLMVTPITATEWLALSSPSRSRLTGARLLGIDSFDKWLDIHHPGHMTYIGQMHEMTADEQDAFDEHHSGDCAYGKSNRSIDIVGLTGTEYCK